MAESYTKATPVFLINLGLSGSGKSVGGRFLAEQRPAIRIRSDVERKRFFQATEANKQENFIRQKRHKKHIPVCLRLQDVYSLPMGYSVVIGVANLKSQQRKWFIGLARSMDIR